MAGRPLPGGGRRYQARARRGAGSAHSGPPAAASSPAPAPVAAAAPPGRDAAAKAADRRRMQATGDQQHCQLLPVQRPAISQCAWKQRGLRLGQQQGSGWFRPANRTYGGSQCQRRSTAMTGSQIHTAYALRLVLGKQSACRTGSRNR